MTEGLELQTAYAQTVRDQDGNRWVVYDESGAKIGALPACLTNQEAMNVLHFGRDHELKAFNNGANVGKARAERAAQVRLDALTAQMDALAEENVRLAVALEKHINLEGEIA